MTNLVVHPRRTQLHAVHDPVDLVDDQSDDTQPGPVQQFADLV